MKLHMGYLALGHKQSDSLLSNLDYNEEIEIPPEFIPSDQILFDNFQRSGFGGIRNLYCILTFIACSAGNTIIVPISYFVICLIRSLSIHCGKLDRSL